MGVFSPGGVKHAFFGGNANPLKVKQAASGCSASRHIGEIGFDRRNRGQKAVNTHIGMTALVDKTHQPWFGVGF
jgi:hypothetical protein